jgi:hypothetical protein
VAACAIDDHMISDGSVMDEARIGKDAKRCSSSGNWVDNDRNDLLIELRDIQICVRLRSGPSSPRDGCMSNHQA